MRFLKFEEVSGKVGMGRTALYELIRAGRFPKPIKLSRRMCRWLEADVDEWIQRVADEFKRGSV